MSKYTKGPWVAFSNSLGVGVSGPVADIAHCGGMDSKRHREEEEANARLIAAAPKMLEALKHSTVQMRIWVSINGDMVGALQDHIDANETIIAAAEPTP